MSQLMILIGSASDLKLTEDGIAALKSAKVRFRLHIASAHRSPNRVHDLVSEFVKQGGKVLICVAGMSAHLAGVVAAMTVKPVIAVPVSRPATAGLDSLLSMSQMPAGVPVATMGLDKAGFTNACIFAEQILALSDARLEETLAAERHDMQAKVEASDRDNSIRFEG